MNLTDTRRNPATNPLNRDPCVFPGCATPEMAPYPAWGFNLCTQHYRLWSEQLDSWDIWQRRIAAWLEKAKKSEAA